MSSSMKLDNISFLDNRNPMIYYKGASIFLMTSAYEGWPMVLTEAMQYGCIPVCMNSFSAVYEMINDNKDGFIISKNNLKLFIEKIELLINNSELRKSMAINAINNCERFTINNVGKKWLDLIYSLSNQSTKGN